MDPIKNISWQAVLLLVSLAACFTAILIFANAETQSYLFGAGGIVTTLIALFVSPTKRAVQRPPALPKPPRTPAS